MSIRKRDVHFSDWTKVRHALVCNNVQGITETSSFDDVRAFLINSESGSNPFYYYVCYIKETKEIYTHGQFYDCLKSGDSVIPEKIEELESTLGTKVDLTVFEELQSDVKENELVTARALTELNEKKADSVDLNAIKAEIEENEKVAAKAFMDLNERKLDKSELDNIDLSNYVDWDTYYNNLNTTNSAINLKADKTTVTSLQTTVNLKANQADLNTLSSEVDLKANKSDLDTLSESLNALSAEVEENEDVTAAALTELYENKADKSEIHDTKVTSAENHYGYNSDNATSTTGAFVTKITKDAANHVTSFESRALTSTDIPGLDASKITSGTIDIARLPKGALEQLHHYETKELAQQAVIDKAVQLGDTVQINNATMYICTNDSATTFATQFTEYVAGTAASVPWSGITGKPTGIDEWGNRIGVIESGYATQSWVGENYLSKSGGTMTGSITTRSNVYSWANAKTVGHIIAGHNAGGNAAPIISTALESGGYGKLAQVSDQFGLYAYSASDSTPSTRIALYPEAGEIRIMGNTIPMSTTTYNLGSSSAKWSNVYATSFIGNLTGNADSATKVNTYITSAALHYPLLFGASADSGATMATGLSYIYKNSVNNVYFIPSEGRLAAPKMSATSFIGNLTGDTANIGTLQIITNEINGANGTGNAHINYSSTGKVTIANGGGDVAIGGTTADEKLHIHGNVKASGSMYATDFCTTSDNRLKDFTKDVIVDFNELKNIPKKYYYWKDKSMGEELQIGTSAQELAKVYPECVSYNEKEDRYSVNYQKLSIIALAAIDKLHERISVLEKKLNDQNS